MFKLKQSYDIEVELSRVSKELQSAISKLEPFGVGNPEPIVRIEDIPIDKTKLIGKNKGSTQFQTGNFQGVSFNDTEIVKSQAQKVSILANIRKTCYNNNIIQFLLKDYKLNLADDPNAINYKLRNSKAKEIKELLEEFAKQDQLDRKLLINIYKIAELSKDRGVYIDQLLNRYNLNLFDLCYILNIFKELKLLDFKVDDNLIKFNLTGLKANLEDSKLLKLYQKKGTNGFS